MISTRYASFISGIAIASVTWAFSLYLYSRLSQNTNTANPTMYVSDSSKNLKESIFDQRSINNHPAMLVDYLKNTVYRDQNNAKDAYNYKAEAKYDFKNSNKLLQQLQPVPVKPAVTVGQGK